MPVNPEDVRAALNEISEEEVATSTIQLKIKDARFKAEKHGLDEGTRAWEKYVRARAALGSFIVSDTYIQADFGDIEVRRAWERILDELKNEVEEALEEAGVTGYVAVSTPMFDDRPKDEDQESDLVVV